MWVRDGMIELPLKNRTGTQYEKEEPGFGFLFFASSWFELLSLNNEVLLGDGIGRT
jgi:hypothetical protein